MAQHYAGSDKITKNQEIKTKILNVGMRHWPVVNSRAIGRDLGIAHTNVLYHFGDIETLRNAIADEAVRVKNSRVIAQLIIEKHKAIASMNEQDRKRHMAAAS